jgi:homoserine O-succinyltransferase
MPLKVNSALPAVEILEKEGVFIMGAQRAEHQDIRPLKILILNLMPQKTEAEVQFLRLLSNTSLQVEIELMQSDTHNSKNTSAAYLEQFYITHSDVEKKKYDGMIITGAPVEKLPYEKVDYWEELAAIMAWSKKNVYSVIHICWGALAGLYYHYGIDKYNLENKLCGVFRHKVMNKNHPLFRGFDDYFYAPHSRYSSVKPEEIKKHPDLEILAYSEKAGVHVCADSTGRRIFITGHGEYDRDSLAKEYWRDTKKNLNPLIPENYFSNNDTSSTPILNWKSHATLLISNWLNYFVYQKTPYNINEIE